MTLSSNVNRSGPYTGNGLTTTFARTFLVLDADHLQVFLTVNGVTNEVTTGFVKGGIGQVSGNVVFSQAPAAGTLVTLIRSVPILQETDYPSQSTVAPEQIEKDFDLQTMMIQDLRERIDRSYSADITGKTFGPGNVPTFASNGDLVDSGVSTSELIAATVRAETARDEIASIIAGEGFYLTPEMYGAQGGANFDTESGPDDSGPFASMLADAAAHKMRVKLNDAYYLGNAGVMSALGDYAIAAESLSHGIIPNTSTTQNAVQIAGPTRLSGFRIHTFTSAGKAPDSGHLQSCIGLTSGYIANSDLQQVSGFHISKMRLTRNVGDGGGYALNMVGNIGHGYIGDIDDIGSASYHSGLILGHWGGRNATGVIGDEITKSWHVRHVEIGAIYSERSHNTLVLSSTVGVVQRGLFVSKNAKQILKIMPGDETDRVSQHEAGVVGKGNKIMGPIFGIDLQDESTTDAIEVFSAGTSRGSTQPGDPGIDLQEALEMDVEIGPVTIVNSPNADKKLIDISLLHGSLKMGEINCFGCEATKDALNFTHCMGQIEIESFNGDFAVDAINLTRSSNVKIGKSKVSTDQGTVSSQRVLYGFGDTESAAIAGPHQSGDVEVDLTAGLARRVMPGQRILINGEPVRAVKYTPVGAVRLFLEPLPSAVSASDPVVIDHGCFNIDLNVDLDGGYYGFDLSRVQADLRGSVSNAGYSGGRFRNGCSVDLWGMKFSGNGTLRAGDVSAATSDIDVTDDLNRIRMHGGELGRDGGLTSYNVRCSGVEGTHRRFVATNVSFLGNINGEVTASSQNNHLELGCTAPDGSLI